MKVFVLTSVPNDMRLSGRIEVYGVFATQERATARLNNELELGRDSHFYISDWELVE